MADLIDYRQVKDAAKDAAKDANTDVKAEIGRLASDLQNMLQRMDMHTNRLDNLQNRFGPITNLQQQLKTMEAKIDQLTAHMQAIVSRLP